MDAWMNALNKGDKVTVRKEQPSHRSRKQEALNRMVKDIHRMTRQVTDLTQGLCQLLDLLVQLLVVPSDCILLRFVHLMHTRRCYVIKPGAGSQNCPLAAWRPA